MSIHLLWKHRAEMAFSECRQLNVKIGELLAGGDYDRIARLADELARTAREARNALKACADLEEPQVAGDLQGVKP